MIEIKHKIVTEDDKIISDDYIIYHYSDPVFSNESRLLNITTLNVFNFKQLKEEINKINIK